MARRAVDDPILQRYKAALLDLYGERIERVVLFGSRARGDDLADSDYDVAVFLKALPERWPEFDRLAGLRLEFLASTGEFFNATPFPADAYADRTPLMREIRRDGLTV